ncbi:MAG: asparagine synthase (glutamine-hydrolyzing) [Planctomycetota bacterium]|jgi:asparagine synthase (glutamine-hydrolysing)
MCGIAGYVGTAVLDRRRVDHCLRLMHHRGPDASGVYEHATPDGRRVCLLHTRLGIIDLDDRSNQPMRDGDHVLVFNGELYNYCELREARGWTNGRLRTAGDTEVLLRVLATDGWRGLEGCEGMWAFALYDEADGTLRLSRDRFGEKPLYVYETEDGLYFGSEIKLITALAGRRLAIDLDHVLRYLVNGYKALYKNGAAFYRGLREVTPGTVLEVGPGRRQVERRYWRPSCDRDEDLAYDEAVEAVREALVRSVELRLRADVPLAFLLSGGVDSNGLAAVARRVLGREVHAFTIVNEDARYDERPIVDAAVRELDIRHTAIPLDTAGFLDGLRDLVRQHDVPVCTITYYAQWLLMRAVAEHGYRVSISGTGADELFSGYYDHHNAYLYEVRGDDECYHAALSDWQRWVRPLVRNPHLSDPDLFIRDPDFRGHIFLDADVFAGWLHRPWGEPFSEQRYCDGLLRNRMLNELFHEVVPPILHADDHNAMAASIENRSPYLDRGLFHLAQRIPTRHLVRHGRAKAVLRDALRGIAPDPVLNERRKVGFNAPIAAFLDVRDEAVRREVLADTPIYEHVRREAIEALLDADELPNSRSKFLFNFLNAKILLEEFAS